MDRARISKQQGDWATAKRLLLEGQPHQLAALKADPTNASYRQSYRNYLALLIEVHAGLLEQEEAVRTAETYRDLGWDPPLEAYDGACYLSRCIPIVAQHDKLDDRQRKEAVQFYGDAAMKLLRQALDKGYRDGAHMMDDSDLDPLRMREDFDKLIAELDPPVPARARYFVRLSQWDKAAAAYAKADLLSRPMDDNAFAYACLFLIRGDSEGYERFCQGMILRVAQAEDPAGAYVLARTWAMARKSPVEPARAVQWADQAVASSHKPWDYHVLGLAQYRAGQYDPALQSFTKANVEGWTLRDLNWFGLALVHLRMGHPDEARQSLDKGIEWLERESPPGLARPTKLLPQDWLEAQLLRREAEEMLKIKRSP